MCSALKLIAIHFQFMEDDLNIIAYYRTLKIPQWSSSLKSKPLYELFLYVNESSKYLLVIGFMYDLNPENIRSKCNLI